MSSRLVSFTERIDAAPDLVSMVRGLGAYVWVREGDGFVAWGQAASINPGAGPERFERASSRLASLFDIASIEDDVLRPGTGPIAYASYTFDPSTAGSRLVVPAVVVGRAGGECWVTVNGIVGDPVDEHAAAVGHAERVVSEEAWMRAVARVRDQIRGGWLEKVVLARAVTVHGSFDPRAIAGALAEVYPQCYTYCFDGLVGASPELLCRRTDALVESLVLAGTTRRSDDIAEDERLGATLFASSKERSEHELAVGTVRDVLSLMCSELKVETEPSLLGLANVQHLATHLRGDLAEPATALEIAGRLHPTAAVCGVPTHDALALIRSLEGFDRGRYAGPIGWVDSRGDGEFAIALRCAEISQNEARLFAGNGIVADSDPAAELAETELKLRAVRSAMRA
ncbi:MAG: isochorismate synthase MenF [Actinomycetota bacterium]|nr:isochorismate synthase [Actinomycetota bacterium]